MKTLKRPGLDRESNRESYRIIYALIVGCLLIYMETYSAELESLAASNLKEIKSVLADVDDCQEIKSGASFIEYKCGDRNLMISKYDNGDTHRKGLLLKKSNGFIHVVGFHQDPETKEYGSFVTTVSQEDQKPISRNTDVLYFGLSHHPESFGKKADKLYEEFSLKLK